MPSAKRERQREGRQARVLAAEAERRRRQRWKTIRNFGLIVVVIIAVIFVISLRNGDDNKVATTSSSTAAPVPIPAGFTYGNGPCPNADGSSPKTIDFTDAPQECIDPSKTYTATFDTSIGTVSVKLDTDTTPGTTNNFVVLARYHYFDGTQIFRTDQSIGIVQGGSPHTNTANDPGPGYDLPDEGFDYAAIGGTGGPYSYAPGDLVMARTSSPNGAGAQFFFAVTDKAAALDSQGVYVKFGTTTQGLDQLAFFLASEPAQAPAHPVTINTVTITES
jgi:cyclophilin family peptidyl-prolyl cis-trans isomerase